MKKYYNSPEFAVLNLNIKDVITASAQEPNGFSAYAENGGAGAGNLDTFAFPF